METERQPTRRGFLDGIIAVGAGITGTAMTVPALAYLWPAARGGGAENVEVEGASNLSVGGARMLQVAGKAVIVVRSRTGFRAFAASCTHLGCLVTWDTAKSVFLCPCHAAVFDENGDVVSGPPPAPLPELKVKEIGEKIYVTAV